MADEEFFDPWTRDYAMLGLRMDRLFPGTVDGWIGPSAWREAVQAENVPEPQHLARDAEALIERLPEMGYDSGRKECLTRQAVALLAQAQVAAGAELPFAEQARRFFDIEPERKPESAFQAAHERLEEALPGQGSLLERVTTWRQSLELTREQLRRALASSSEEVRTRTAAHLSLPSGEGVEVELVTGKPWSAYNRYLGTYRSSIEVNVDIPRSATAALEYMAHEAYPGHHVEQVLRESRQFRGRGQGEYAILLINTPQSVISEAVATCARETVFPGDEDLQWLSETAAPALGVQIDALQAARVRAAMEGLDGVGTNAAYLLHEDGRPAEEVAEYVSAWSLIPLDRARQFLRFAKDPLWRVYPFTYRHGRRLLRPLLQGTNRWEALERVCSEPVYPSLLAEWSAA